MCRSCRRAGYPSRPFPRWPRAARQSPACVRAGEGRGVDGQADGHDRGHRNGDRGNGQDQREEQGLDQRVAPKERNQDHQAEGRQNQEIALPAGDPAGSASGSLSFRPAAPCGQSRSPCRWQGPATSFLPGVRPTPNRRCRQPSGLRAAIRPSRQTGPRSDTRRPAVRHRPARCCRGEGRPDPPGAGHGPECPAGCRRAGHVRRARVAFAAPLWRYRPCVPPRSRAWR